VVDLASRRRDGVAADPSIRLGLVLIKLQTMMELWGFTEICIYIKNFGFDMQTHAKICKCKVKSATNMQKHVEHM
jgi:hypothetical protein